MSEELARYLKSKKGLNRLFIKLKEKYVSLGRYSGVITLNNVTKEESIDIGNLLGYRVNEGDNIKTSYKELTKKFLETKYYDFNWEELLNSYFDQKIISKKKELEIGNRKIILDGVQEPGNLGTIIRSGVGFNFDSVI